MLYPTDPSLSKLIAQMQRGVVNLQKGVHGVVVAATTHLGGSHAASGFVGVPFHVAAGTTPMLWTTTVPIMPASSCSARVRVVSTGAWVLTLTLTPFDPAKSAVTTTNSGTGTSQGATVSLAPGTITAGVVSLRITNSGSSSLTATTLSITGA